MMWRIKLERKNTLNQNQAGRVKYDYASAATEDEAKKQVESFPRNKAFIATEARRA